MKILFVHNYPPDRLSSFVQHDLAFLREMAGVEVLSVVQFARISGLLASPAAWQAVRRNDLVFGWFGTAAAPFVAIARLLGRPAVVVAGGADVVDLPEIGYGLGSVPRRYRWLVRLGYAWATRVLAFSDASRRSIVELPLVRRERVRTLYLSVDADRFRPGGHKAERALTVGQVTENNLQRKGLSTFVEAARLAPGIAFHLVGRPVDDGAVRRILAQAPPNLKVLGHLDDAQLRAEYREARAYAQLSLHEGFGMSLAEAMASECVPVVTDAGALPELVGDAGCRVPPGDPAAAARAIERAIASPGDMGQRARARIVQLFSPDRRRAGLREALSAAVAR